MLLKAKSMGLPRTRESRAVTPNKLNLLNLNALVLLIDVNYFISLFSQNNQENKSPFLLCFAPVRPWTVPMGDILIYKEDF